ncbi:MAG: hypothetical protein DI603_18135 [Roseateles depolymerans]|uniref:XRE family transcriptional regulator n=1 Tax=Roseateles depolymerans TaxID=76731 RepID=A0A2W5DEP8_9BURK|nr:MAG: hypothetical protein DI603_18135 [Roseateles depolymerans]
MANLATALKSEIARIARKELRDEFASLRKTVTGHRTDIAKLKRELTAANQELRRLRREVARNAPAVEAAGEPDASKFRYSAERLAASRAKLGLSAEDYGLLVGSSGLSVYKWERGVKPRQRFMPALAAAFKMGKREAAARLQAIKAAAA